MNKISKQAGFSRFFKGLSVLRPQKPKYSSTWDSKWIRNTLEDSRVDVASFGAHSTRHAWTSAAARKGINIETIRKTAGWTEKSTTFARFYNQPIQLSEDFERPVIGQHK
ncbi:hypothetical protein TKK_0012538 [Trichogramma kaykai]